LNATGKPDPTNPLTVLEETDFEFLSFVCVDVRKTVMRREAQSILKKCKPLLYEINDRLTQLSIQFLKHLNAKPQIPDGSVQTDKDGKVKTVNLEAILARAGQVHHGR
jgi:hypothetical protein